MDRKAELERHIVLLDAAIEAADPGNVAALVRERRITVNELASVPADSRKTRDEIAAKRDARRAAAAAAAAPPARRRVKRSS